MENHMFSKFRKSAAIALTSVIALSAVMSASAASTTKNLSSNFTLVNLANGSNAGTIQYVLGGEAGGTWRPSEPFTLNSLGAQIIRRQYDDASLPAGSGSVVVSTDGPVGAVVQIQARDQTPTSGAYVGVSEGAAQANVPLVSRRGNSASGRTNSQIIIQNASSIQINVEVQLIDSTTGATSLTKTFNNIAPNASVEYDLDTEGGLPEGWFGSASVRSTTAGGEVAVVSNFFTGDDAMQTFNAFTSVGRQWYAPLFTSRLANSLSSPISVQNVTAGSIPAGAITLTCTKDPSAPGPATINTSNPAPVGPSASVFFNPVTDNTNFPDGWYGSCVVNSGTYDTAMFVQLRFVNGSRAGAYEGILGTGTNKTVVIPLYAKRLANSFASAVTIQNLNAGAAATVRLEYKAGDGAPANCTTTLDNVTIPAGGSLIQNHRIADGPNSVPQLPDGCFGTLTVTSSNQPIDAFVQLDFLNLGGDAFMAHNAFTVSTAQ
jgi:hypothetical protein